MRYLQHMAAVAAIATALAAGAAHAQVADRPATSAAPKVSDEIIVTATKTGAQDIQEVPLAIQVFSGEDLRERNITTIGDLVSSVPGAQEGFRQSNGSRFYNLRGNVTQNGDFPIGYYLDDTPFIVTNFGIAPPVRFIDMERVEVLRGPQGTLYGQGSSGGVFIFHTRDPDLNDIEYAFEAEVGTTRSAEALNYGFAAAASVPIIKDRLAIRVSGGLSRDAGYADAYFGPFDGTPDQVGVNEAPERRHPRGCAHATARQCRNSRAILEIPSAPGLHRLYCFGRSGLFPEYRGAARVFERRFRVDEPDRHGRL